MKVTLLSPIFCREVLSSDVYSGFIDWENRGDSTFGVNFITYNDFNPQTMANDIALIEIIFPLEFNGRYILPNKCVMGAITYEDNECGKSSEGIIAAIRFLWVIIKNTRDFK